MGEDSELRGYVYTHLGCVRKNNEDNYLLGKCINEDSEKILTMELYEEIGKWICFGVFDGMGGLENGEKASHIAAECFQEISLALEEIEEKNVDEIIQLVYNSFKNADEKIQKLDESSMKAGTTATIMLTDGNAFKIFHIGDSRAYICRNGKIIRLTKDQTIAQMKIDMGIYLSENEMGVSDKSQLTDYLGMHINGMEKHPLESEWMQWQKNDKILLCSDGLYNKCCDQNIYDIMIDNGSLEKKAKSLVDHALKLDGNDNITVMLLEK